MSIAAAIDPPFHTCVAEVLAAVERERSGEVILAAGDRPVSTHKLAERARQWTTMFSERGLKPGDAVATMEINSADYCALILGLCLARLLWVPISPEARGLALAHVLRKTAPAAAFVMPEAVDRLVEAGFARDRIETDTTTPNRSLLGSSFEAAPPDEARAILFTSGTTGPPKGVIVTERMLIASAAGCAFASDCKRGATYLMWEPLHHIGGIQVLLMALVHGARLVMVPRFSASGFWPTVRAHGIDRLHYLGGILEILLKAEPRAGDRDHPIQLAFGGGCRPEIWRAFSSRFGVPIREVWGQTEASSFATINMTGAVGSIGTPVPWFEVEVFGPDGKPVSPGDAGELVVSASHPGLLTPGYLGDNDATAALLRGGRLHSGDLGRRDAEGNFHFLGRVTDSLRRRGENISAWEVETALTSNPAIAECAVVGVAAEIGEHDILCFVVMRDGHTFDPATLDQWCRAHLPRAHVPRYWKQVTEFERTPSQRIRKDVLDRGLGDAVDVGGGAPTH